MGTQGLELNSVMDKHISQRKLEANRKNSILGAQATRNKFLFQYLANSENRKKSNKMVPAEGFEPPAPRL